MKHIVNCILCIACALGVLALSACSTTGTATPPTDQQVAAINAACATDAAIRPSVTVLMAIPGLATPQEAAGIVAARAIIDQICANPSASLQASGVTALSGAVGQVVAYVAQLEARKAAADQGPAK